MDTARDDIRLAQAIEIGEAAVEQYRAVGLDTSEPVVAAEYGQLVVDRLRSAGLDALAEDLGQDVADLRAFGRDGFELIGAHWWAEG